MAATTPLHRLRRLKLPEPARPSGSGELGVLVFVAVVAALYCARDVLIPLALAVLLSILLAPLVALLRRARFGRVPAVLVAVIVAVGLICAIGGLIGSQIAELADNLPDYAHTVEGKVDQVQAYAGREFGRLIKGLGGGATAPAKPVAPQRQRPAAAAPAPSPSPATPMPVEVHQPDPTPLEFAVRYLSPILTPLGTVAVVFVVAVFILLQADDLRDRAIRLFGSGDLRRTTVALDDGGRRLSRYFLTQLGINACFGIVLGLGLIPIGLPSPLLWGVLAALLRFVPYIGTFIAMLFPVALAAAVDPGWSMMVWTGGLFLVIEAIAGQLVEPFVYGNSTGLSPLSVVVAAIFWSWLWGPIGLILSTPLTLCLVVLGRHVEHLEFLDIMLGDQPALTPVEGFYHRMLAGDQDEARDHAEALLKDRSLMSYYDEVALPGLELAAIDAERGTITAEQLSRMIGTINELVDDLAGHLDREPGAAARTDTSPPDADPGGNILVLCVAGRGPLDEAAAAMLAQLLSKHGIASRIAPYEAATRGNINMLALDDVEMVCVSYLDTSGKQAHLRYLLQRLRQRLPVTPIVVGMWPNDDPSTPDAPTRALLGADHYTRTLRETVELCRTATLNKPTLPVSQGRLTRAAT